MPSVPPGQVQQLIDDWLAQADAIEEVREILPVTVPSEWLILMDNKAETLTACANDLAELLE